MSTLRANTLKPITSGNSLVLQGDSGGSGVSGPSIDSNGDVDFSQNTNAKIKLPSAGGIYESDGSTQVLTESGGSVTIENATIGDSVVLSDKYYLQANLDATYSSSLPKNINFDESTSPYWVFTSDSDWHVSGTGSNFSQGTTTSDLKIHRAGIYLVNFSATGLETSAERSFDVRINGVGSGSSAILARSIDNIAIGEAGGSYGSASASLIYKFNANDQINFNISSANNNSADISIVTHFNICLIRPL